MNRKIVCAFLILVLSLVLCACSSARSNYASVVPEEAESIDFSNSVTVVNPPTSDITTTPTPVPTATATPVPTTVATVTATPTPTIVVVNTNTSSSGNPITKSPYDDFVGIGGTVKFVAGASNYSSLRWVIKSADGCTTTSASNAPNVYPGLCVSGQNSTTLVLSNVPASMDNCLIQCIFTRNGTDYYTNNAILSIINTTPTPTDSILTKANTCRELYANTASSYGYTSGSIYNYSVASSTTASFNVDFTNTAKGYVVRTEFYATASDYGPVYAYVYDATGTVYKGGLPIADTSDFDSLLSDPTKYCN